MAEHISETIIRVMLEIVAAQPDPAEQAAMLEIMRKDGWLSAERVREPA